MAELFTIIGEGLVALGHLLAAWGRALIEGLVFLGCFLFSRSFRAKKLELWKVQPHRKFFDLALATFWFALVILLPILLFASAGSTSGRSVDTAMSKPRTNEGLRVELRTQQGSNQHTIGTVVVKKGGMTKMLDTKSLKELKTQVIENVSFVPSSSVESASKTNR